MKYRVVGNYLNGKKAYWNDVAKGWYCVDYEATVFSNTDKASYVVERAEVTMTVDCVDNIHYEEIK